MDFFLLPILLGAGLTFVICALRAGRKRQPPSWLPLYVGFATGFLVVLLGCGSALFTAEFWTTAKMPGAIPVAIVFGLAALASSVTSFGILHFYRDRRHE
jgi:hypothetical protein